MSSSQLICICVRTEGPTNLGLISRLCANMGAVLRLVDPQCDRACDEARRFANKTADALQEVAVFPDLSAALADCVQVLGTSARPRDASAGASLALKEVPAWQAARPAGQTAVVFGNEATGLRDDELRLCQAYIHLDMPGSYQSFNLSSAVGIVLYGLLGEREAASNSLSSDADVLTMQEREQLKNYWLGSLERFGYFEHFGNRMSVERKLQSLVQRLPFDADDLHILRASLSQFNYVHFGDKAAGMARSGQAPEPSKTVDNVDKESEADS